MRNRYGCKIAATSGTGMSVDMMMLVKFEQDLYLGFSYSFAGDSMRGGSNRSWSPR